MDWEALSRSYLSGTEVAALQIASGVALVECHGGIPSRVRAAVFSAVDAIVGDRATRSPRFQSKSGVGLAPDSSKSRRLFPRTRGHDSTSRRGLDAHPAPPADQRLGLGR